MTYRLGCASTAMELGPLQNLKGKSYKPVTVALIKKGSVVDQ